MKRSRLLVLSTLATWGVSQSATVSAADRADLVRLRPPQSAAVYLRPLTFQMGSSEEETLAALVRCKREPLPDRCDETTFANEGAPHQERVGGFWMARTEVTVADYGRCVAAGRCSPAGYEGGGLRFAKPTLPVTLVTFEDARRYCAFRGGRLPTEAEFERAARGAARRSYPWGDRYHGKLANHGRLGVDATDTSDGFAELAPVGSYPDGATPEGVLDLAGNVAEWTADAYVPSYGAPPTGERAVRGGDFTSAAPFLRGAARASKPPEARLPTLGFRCVWPVRPLRE
jgi:formylglycine-generating enzyme